NWGDSSNFSFQVIENELVIPSDPAEPVSFSFQTLSHNGSRMGVADMNGDFLDDIITIPSAGGGIYNLNIYYQQTNGSFQGNNYFPEANSQPLWSLAAGDIDGNGFNDVVWGDTSDCSVVKANANGTAYTTIATNSVF